MTRWTQLIVAGAAAVLGAAPAAAQSTVPIRRLTPVVRADSGVLASIIGVRQLPGGRVLVNDAQRHRVLAFDSTLAHATVVLDSVPGTPNSYGTQRGFIVPFVGDSTVFIDVEARAFIVLDPAGRVARTMAPPPNAGNMLGLAAASNSAESYDPQGRFIYRTSPHPLSPLGMRPRGPADTMSITMYYDTAAVVRFDAASRAVDTIAYIGLPMVHGIEFRLSDGGSIGYSAVNPLPLSDEWAVLSDGTVALVRGHDYHVDFVHPDGSKSSGAKLPFDWRNITSDDKHRLLDSAHTAFDEMIAKLPPPKPAPNGQMPPPRRFYAVDPSEMPDFYPPLRPGQVHADCDGNIWVLPTTSASAQNGLLFDVINSQGRLVERVQLPPLRNVVGFGPGGVVYLASYMVPGAPQFERARIIR